MRRRLVIVAGAMAALVAFAVVQGADHCHQGSAALSDVGKISSELNLSVDQKSRLQEILHSDPPGPAREQAFRGILNPDQLAKYRSMRNGRC